MNSRIVIPENLVVGGMSLTLSIEIVARNLETQEEQTFDTPGQGNQALALIEAEWRSGSQGGRARDIANFKEDENHAQNNEFVSRTLLLDPVLGHEYYGQITTSVIAREVNIPVAPPGDAEPGIGLGIEIE